MWINGKFDIYKDAFAGGVNVYINFGDGTHVFRNSVDFYFSYTVTTTTLNVDPGLGTIILWPAGLRTIISL